ncbi:hypothetical protein ABZ626_01655 [Streptomyces longispororuber]|uniref:hypothetical protein n=1 Tax=Streptomyces longispororuber TaxID=68230 RepID=UPI0033C8D3DB
MGWTVLYIAFGVVALWLLGEVLLQYKARLRWRLLAFGGFLGVVVGVLLPSVPVIAAGAVAFAVGQTYVTLSFRRGFAQGWALGGKPGASKRRPGGSKRRKAAPGAAAAQPTLQVTEVAYEPGDGPAAADALESTAMLDVAEVQAAGPGAPVPVPGDAGQYGGHDGAPQPPSAAGDGYAFDTYAGYDQQGAQDPMPLGYGDTGEQRYAAYSDPYIGPQYGAQPGYDAYADPQPAYAPYGGDAYGTGYQDTPPGGVWVPHQRVGDAASYGAELPPDQPPYPPFPAPGGEQEQGNAFGYEPGHNGEQQYRY